MGSKYIHTISARKLKGGVLKCRMAVRVPQIQYVNMNIQLGKANLIVKIVHHRQCSVECIMALHIWDSQCTNTSLQDLSVRTNCEIMASSSTKYH